VKADDLPFTINLLPDVGLKGFDRSMEVRVFQAMLFGHRRKRKNHDGQTPKKLFHNTAP
jgi:hypothetical protein